jgi:hypothetical protein
MTDWATTAASAATAAGTLILAVATFSSVRSAHQSARATETALLAGIRPVLVPSRLEDAAQKVGFIDDRFFRVPGGQAVVELTDDAIYLVISLRNVGNGLAVLDRWALVPDRLRDERTAADVEGFRRLTRDLYVPAGDMGFWQGALRDPDEPLFAEVRDAAKEPRAMTDSERLVVSLSCPSPRESGWYRSHVTGTSTDPIPAKRRRRAGALATGCELREQRQ